MMQTLKKCVFLLFLFGCLTSCQGSQTPSERRAARAATAQGDIVIGIVDSSTIPSRFLDGVRLAVEELNQSGGVLGRPIKVLERDDEGDEKKGRQIAKKFANNPDVIAVIGHRLSEVAIPVSIIYEENGILFLSHGASDPNLTRYGGNYIFRNIPSGEEVGYQAAEFAFSRNITKGVIFYQREDSYKRIVENFNARAGELKIQVLTTRSFFDTEDDFKEVLSAIKQEYENKFDGIFIVGSLPAAGILIKQARDIKIEAAILGTDGLDSPLLWTEAGRAAEGTAVVTVFNPEQPSRVIRNFVSRFKARYGVDTDTWAAQGYDAVQVLAHAIEESGSTVPITVASTLRFLANWEGVTGSYSFSVSGDITGKKFFFKEAKDGSFQFLEFGTAAEIPIDSMYAIEDITLRLPLPGEIPTLDPGLSSGPIASEVFEQLFLGLTDLAPETYHAVPELAESWTLSEDGTVYQFRLHPGVVWTDGTPVTAHDVVWTIRRNLTSFTLTPALSNLLILKNARAIREQKTHNISALGVRAIDDLTVEFTLEYPAAYFPTLVSTDIYRPLPKHVIDEYGENWTDPKHIQTNGSYRLVEWKEGGMMILHKNEGYYDAEQVSIPEVRYFIIPSSAVGLAMYEQNELDILGGGYLAIPSPDIGRLKGNPELGNEYSNQPKFCTVAYGFNTKRPPVDNLFLRKAIAAAIDRHLLIELSTRGEEELATTFTRPPIFGAVDPQEKIGISFNPTKAQEWLSEAGYPDGESVPDISILYDMLDFSRTAYPLRDFLKYYLNIEVDLYPASLREYKKMREQPNTPHLFRFAWCANYPDANNFLNENFHPLNSTNRLGWNNTEFAELIEKAAQITEPEARKALYKRAEEILCEEEAVVIPLYYERSPTLVNPRVKGWYHMAFGGQHIRNWSLEE